MAKRKTTPVGERLRRQQALFGKPANDPKPASDRMVVPVEAPQKPNRHPNNPWSPELVARLTKLWTEDGATAREIAADLSRVLCYRITPSAVRSKIGKLDLTGKGACDGRGGRPKGSKTRIATGSEKRGDLSTGSGVETETGKPVTEQDQRVGATVRGNRTIERPARNITENITRPVRSSEGKSGRGQSVSPLTQHGAATPGSRFGDGKAPAGYVAKSQLGPTGHRVEHPSDVPTDLTIISAPTTKPAENIPENIPAEPNLEALFGVRLTERPTHPAGQWPITDLRMGQCRYIAGDDHLCCGEVAPVSERNPHGSWCEAHRAIVFGTGTEAERRVFVAGSVR